MATPGKMKEIQVDEVIRLLNEQKSMPKVARILDMSDSGLFKFIEKHNIKKQVKWVKTA